MAERKHGLHLKVQQDGPIALDAELACEPGEVLALVGPSGSGKSTLLRCIAGLYTPEHGRIQCDGEPWFDSQTGYCVPTAKRRIGMVFQHYALFPHLSALENIMEAMRELSADQRLNRAHALIERLHLNGLAQRRPHELSGGQQQRVAVARALAREPKVLLLDEPFSAVDRATRESLYNELAELRRELRMPVVLVTHDLDEATLLADRMCILSSGSTLQAGQPDQLMQAPGSIEVARLVGMRNVFVGRVIEHAATHSLLEWHGQMLKVRAQPQWPMGDLVGWGLPTSGVLLMPQTHEPAEMDNTVSVEVERLLSLGEHIRALLRLGDDLIAMNVPRHLAQRYELAEGQRIAVRLRGETIHLMPAG
ncbi:MULTISPECIES: ABC transporter ATP-binding protein [Pseudomonas fluorescens group]|uniref:ABC transporter n=1 Tax=Pseudomonas azotoformans TaxID=47878 RepID=A0A4Q0HSV8_PSEAZ|nr:MULTISPECIES: ABC transporter ATP-binding protein [Pseudomonas fluorescens group]RXE51774.1 ABC transporter [Pseudomonas azotoformans]